MSRRQSWQRRGVIIDVAAQGYGQWKSHAQMPTPLDLGNGRIRLYFAGRNDDNKSLISFVDVDADDPSQILRVSRHPVIERGPKGTFDADGMMPTAVVRVGRTVRLFYVGLTQRKDVPFHNAIGLAESLDGGETFTRIKRGPVVGTGPDEPYFSGTAEVLQTPDGWRMFYMSATGWREIDGYMEPFYNIRSASSEDGVAWRIDNRTVIDFANEDEGGIARASVWRSPGGKWHMWFCVRDWKDYRTVVGKGYRLGYAWSRDGVRWIRSDRALDFANPASAGEWDHAMQAYPAVMARDDRLVMFYNGNDFGRHALGYAELPASALD